MRKLCCILAYLALVLEASAQLTISVTPGYTFSPGEFPTTATLNMLGQPTIAIAGTITGTVGLGAGTVTGVHLADSVPDGITLDYNGASPRQLEIKSGGVSSTQIGSAAVTTAKIADGAVTASKIPAAVIDTTNFVFGMPGMVIAWASSTVPAGWLECNGQAVSRSVASGGSVDTYKNLWAVVSTTWGTGDGSTTFNVPDLRGEFIRGWDDGRGVDSGRGFATHQNDALKDHTHNLPANTFLLQAGSNFSPTGNNDRSSATATGNVTSPNNGGTETRPRNSALMYVIKY